MSNHPFSLDGKTILITGASSGIGRACAQVCSQLGASLILTGRNEERLSETLASLPQDASTHRVVPMDITQYDAVASEMEKLEKEAPARIDDGPRPAPAAGLTNRQREVLRLMAHGLTNKEIADRLSLSTRTVEMHVARTLERLHCRTRAQAVHKATELGVE